MAALQGEMAPLDAQVRSELKRNGESCPTADKQADFQAILTKFIDLSPEDLIATLEKAPAAEKNTESQTGPKL